MHRTFLAAAPHLTNLLRRMACLAAAPLAVASLAGCTGSTSLQDRCEVDGVTYSAGDSVPAADGCNTCSCLEDGSIGNCSEMGCVTTCDMGFTTLLPGETMADGCNSCSCDERGQLSCTAMACSDACDWEGKTYFPGDTFPAKDGCNTCSCDMDGFVSCTEIHCASSCEHGGEQYDVGDSFPSEDGCNSCTCGEGGIVACTDMACTCDPEAEYNRNYITTDPETCKVIKYACPENTQTFANDCGCGCEQDASCEQVYDCKPPKDCDIEAITSDCPYSTVAL